MAAPVRPLLPVSAPALMNRQIVLTERVQTLGARQAVLVKRHLELQERRRALTARQEALAEDVRWTAALIGSCREKLAELQEIHRRRGCGTG